MNTRNRTRTKVLKTYVNADEEKTILQECAAAGVTRSDQARAVMLHWATGQRNGRRSIGRREGPSGDPRRSQFLPSRPNYGAVPNMRMNIRV